MWWPERRLSYESSETGDDDDVWTALDGNDFVHLGITMAYQVIVLLVVILLWTEREWPPYVPRQISLVCMTGLAGVVSYLGVLISSGIVDRHDGEVLAHCGLMSLFDYAGWGVWISAALVRVYRSWKILVKHSVDMWPAWAQVALLSLPFLIPAVAYTIDENLSRYNERRNWCETFDPLHAALYLYGCVPIVSAFGLVYQMRKVRKQMNEYRMQVLQLLFLLITGGVVFPLQKRVFHSTHSIRRIWVMYHNVLSSLILFWPPIAEPLYRYMRGDEEYLHSYTKGFSTLPTPSQMRSSLKDQLSLEELRQEFEKFAEMRVARELPDFYKACLDREDIEDFFERQAVTTAIIDSFIRPGSVQEINLSACERDKILATDVTSYNIFDDAMATVLVMMETNLSAAFQKCEAYKELERKALQEADELERLRKMKQLPPRDHVEREPNFLLRLVREMMASRPRRRRRRRVSSRKRSDGDDEEDVYELDEEDYQEDDRTCNTTRQTEERSPASGIELHSVSSEGPALDVAQARAQRQDSSHQVWETEAGFRSERRYSGWRSLD